MTENISVTRIVDLPDTFTQDTNGLSSDMYIPMNVHPNPYGMPPPPPGGMAPPQQTQTGPTQYANTMYSSNVNTLMNNESNELYAGGVNQRLPQRDVPINIAQHMQDEEIQPNYIPKPKITADYIQEYQETTEKKNREHEDQKKKEQIAENWFDELHLPILVALLYFVFQMPIVNTLIFKRFAFLAIYKEDGNFNLTEYISMLIL